MDNIAYTDIVKVAEQHPGYESTPLGKRIGTGFTRVVSSYNHGINPGLIVLAFTIDNGESSLFVFKSIIPMSSTNDTLVTSNQYAVLRGNREHYYALMDALPLDAERIIPESISPTVWIMELMSNIMGIDLMAGTTPEPEYVEFEK